MASQSILLFEYYLLAAQVFSQDFVQKAKDKATGASSVGQIDTWHDEVFKLELVQKTIEATIYDQLRARLLSPHVIWPEDIVPGERADIGAVIRLKEETYPDEEYLLTGDTAVPQCGFITVRSPLGRSLVGATKGSTIDVQMPAGSIEVQVLDVSYDVSTVLMRYLGCLCGQARRELEEIRAVQRFQTFIETARSVHSGSSRADVERDYFEFMASIGAHTAILEAILLVIEAYHLSTPVEEECRQKLAEYHNLFEEHEIPFASLTAASYCHPERV